MKELFRAIPQVDQCLRTPAAEALTAAYGRAAAADALRAELAELRALAARIPEGGDDAPFRLALEDLPRRTARRLERDGAPRFRRVINATGMVLHTNLGRAPLSGEVLAEAAARLTGYSNLEFDLETGERGDRTAHFESLLTRLTGAEAALAVNNNAAAVLLIVSALAAGREVIVSRGELVEIGGRFRVPEVLEQGGAVLREVGTTNKTHPEDYRRAVCEQTAAILKVHTSNYKICGFTESVPVEELTGMGVPVIHDLGSGVLLDLERFGLEHEPTVQESVRAGADLVCFSGDKLLGGPQAGLIVGRRELVERLRRHPLLRALRIGKFTAAALELTLRRYETGRALELPAPAMLAASLPELTERAERLRSLLTAQGLPAGWTAAVEPCQSEAGGGSLPESRFPSAAVTVRPCPASLARRLRTGEPPVVGRVGRDRLWLDVRTVAEAELAPLASAVAAALRAEQA